MTTTFCDIDSGDTGKILRSKELFYRTEIGPQGHLLLNDFLQETTRRIDIGDLCLVFSGRRKYYLIMLNITKDFYFDIYHLESLRIFEEVE